VRDAVAAIGDGADLEKVLEQLRTSLGHETMGTADRNRVSVLFSDIRTIARGWHELSRGERTRFAAGSVVPSALAKKMRGAASAAQSSLPEQDE
jgi:class 3 adenylate cyclase